MAGDGIFETDLHHSSVTKLQLDDNVAAYLEKRCLEREDHVTEFSSDNIEKVVTNYVIAKHILSNLSWQDKLVYRHVCSTWRSAINALRKEQLYPIDFSVKHLCHIKQSSTFSNEPLAVFTFLNITGFSKIFSCKNIAPCPCSPPCDKYHMGFDVLHKYICAPKECMMGVKATYVSYLPLPDSKTKENSVTSLNSASFVGGVYIPVIPNVKYHMINLKDHALMKQEFYGAVDKIVTDQVIKGVLVFVTDKHLLHSVEDIVFLNHIKDVQPDVPYAMGGCICEDTMCHESDITQLLNSKAPCVSVSDSLISIGIFSVPKDFAKNECNFDMFSLIIESSVWDKQKIQSSIVKFSKEVPQYEHSVCLKLSCIGRDRKHKVEQEAFRSVFPNTRIVGCYGNGELGIDHPAQAIPEWPPNVPKRNRKCPGPQFGIIYSYSTVFVYMGWGKITSPKAK
ncbi:unnamed protein product [Leptosia nina]|uniref:Uncharacterized protein n=1 Tax=Leptosia nina TaxID=320188 RepID=A0AAV1J942_9NEOP